MVQQLAPAATGERECQPRIRNGLPESTRSCPWSPSAIGRPGVLLLACHPSEVFVLLSNRRGVALLRETFWQFQVAQQVLIWRIVAEVI
jgi:hypothetical protein